MDIDGLRDLIDAHHAETLLHLQDVKNDQAEIKKDCRERIKTIEEEVEKHKTSLTRIKTIGSVLSFVWGTIVLFVSSFLFGR